MKFTRIKISFAHDKTFFTLLFIAGEMTCFGNGWGKASINKCKQIKVGCTDKRVGGRNVAIYWSVLRQINATTKKNSKFFKIRQMFFFSFYSKQFTYTKIKD